MALKPYRTTSSPGISSWWGLGNSNKLHFLLLFDLGSEAHFYS